MCYRFSYTFPCFEKMPGSVYRYISFLLVCHHNFASQELHSNTAPLAQAARILKLGINPNIDPCEDFHAFSCSNFESQVTIPEEFPGFSMVYMVQENLHKLLANELSAGKVYKSPAKQSLQNAFGSCVQEVTDNEIRKRRLRDALKDYIDKLGGFPLLNSLDGELVWQEMDPVNTLATLLRDFGDVAMFAVQVDKDQYFYTPRNERGTPKLNFHVDVRRIHDVERHTTQLSFAKSIRKILGWAADVLAEPLKAVEQLDFDIASMWYAISGFPNCGKSETNYVIELRSLQNNASHLKRVLEGLMPLNEYTLISTECDSEMLGAISNQLSSQHRAQYYTQALQNIFIIDALWKIRVRSDVVETAARSLRNSSMREEAEYSYRHGIGMKADKPADWCVSQLIHSGTAYFNILTARMLLDSEGVHLDSSDNLAIVQLFDAIRNEFRQTILTLDWLSDRSKLTLLRKVDGVTIASAYPLWLDDESTFEKYFYGFEIGAEASYVFDGRLMARRRLVRDIVSLTQGATLHDWVRHDYGKFNNECTQVNAGFNVLDSDVIPAVGVSVQPFFDKAQPLSVQFGLLGTTLSHELMHGFGAKRGGSFLAGCEAERFRHSIECLRDKFSAQCATVANETVCARGDFIAEETAADNTGLRLAFGALRTAIGANLTARSSLPGLANFTEAQIFFISAAKMYCAFLPPQILKRQYREGRHAPFALRVNEQMKNSADFSAAFQCDKGAAMNPETKCRVW